MCYLSLVFGCLLVSVRGWSGLLCTRCSATQTSPAVMFTCRSRLSHEDSPDCFVRTLPLLNRKPNYSISKGFLWKRDVSQVRTPWKTPIQTLIILTNDVCLAFGSILPWLEPSYTNRTLCSCMIWFFQRGKPWCLFAITSMLCNNGSSGSEWQIPISKDWMWHFLYSVLKVGKVRLELNAVFLWITLSTHD